MAPEGEKRRTVRENEKDKGRVEVGRRKGRNAERKRGKKKGKKV